MKSKIVEFLPPSPPKLTDSWPRVYHKLRGKLLTADLRDRSEFKSELAEVISPTNVAVSKLPPCDETYYLCIKLYGGSAKSSMDGGVVMFRLNGGLTACVYTCVDNIEKEVADGKLEQVPNGFRMIIELEP